MMKSQKPMSKSDGRSTPRGRIWGLDTLKAIAICMVVPLHTGPFHADFIQAPTASNFLQCTVRLMSEGVPLFFFVNGFLLLGASPFDAKKHLLSWSGA